MFSETLMATCWTTAGDAASDRADPRSPLPLRQRIEAAADAGFRGFGLHSADLPAAERDHGLPGIRAMLADHGITDLELEAVPQWWADGPDPVRRQMLEACRVLGARHLKVTPDVAGQPFDLGRWAAAFGELAAQAADCGARLGIEFMPFANVATLDDGLRLVEEAGHPGGGVIIDVWHTERAGTPPAALAEVPLDRIVGVELSDAAAAVVGTLFDDTVHRRRYCGDGDFDLPGTLTALRRAGWHGPWGVEILADEHRALPVEQATARAFDTAVAALDAHLPDSG